VYNWLVNDDRLLKKAKLWKCSEAVWYIVLRCSAIGSWNLQDSPFDAGTSSKQSGRQLLAHPGVFWVQYLLLL
jgi:hypothetical protein